MKLSSFDGKCVRITLKDGNVFEGSCVHNCAEFNLAELGINEESLEIARHIFKKSEIKKVSAVDDMHPFLSPFGAIEEEILGDGIEAIADILSDDDPINSERLLTCIEYHLSKGSTDALLPLSELSEALTQAAEYSSSEDVKEKLVRLLGIIGSA